MAHVFRIGVLTVMVCMVLHAQGRGRQRSPNSGNLKGAYDLPAVTMRGSVQRASKSQLVLDLGEESPLVLRCTHRTKYFRGKQSLKYSDLAAGTAVSVDVIKNPDLEAEAVNVFVEPLETPAPAPAPAPAPK